MWTTESRLANKLEVDRLQLITMKVRWTGSIAEVTLPLSFHVHVHLVLALAQVDISQYPAKALLIHDTRSMCMR